MFKIIKSLFVIVAVVGIAGAFTWSQWTGNDKVEHNVLGAMDNGTKIVIDKDGIDNQDIDDSTGNALPVNVDDMYPGYTSPSYYFAVVNKGELPLDWKLKFINTFNLPDPDGLSKVLKTTAWVSGPYSYAGINCQNDTIYGAPAFDDGYVYNWSDSSYTPDLSPNTAYCVKFQFGLDDDIHYYNSNDADDDLFKGATSEYTVQADALQHL